MLDNWGWCSGRCSNSSIYPDELKGRGCYADNADGEGANDCQPNDSLPWINYNGNVVVK